MIQNSTLGAYSFIEEIGSGGMGKVYKAYQKSLGRVVAIKVMLDDQEQKRFLNEAQTMARLDHPNIVKIYDVGKDGKTNFIVMDFIEGVSLAHTSFSLRDNLEIIKQVALAIEYAHQNKVVHRDLKPGNLMITSKNKQVVVMDFGLAKSTKNSSKSGTVLGTPEYMSPEQVMGKKASPLMDIYALGIILYEMTSNKKAIIGETPAETLYNVVHKIPIPLRRHCPQISKDIETICHKAIAKDPQKRYSSALEFAKDIDAFLNGQMIMASRESVISHTYKKIRTNRSTQIGLLICLLSLLISLFFIYYSHRKEYQLIHYYISKAKKNLPSTKEQNSLKILEKCVKVSDFLQKALAISSYNPTLNALGYKVYKRIGILALKEKNYLLAQIAFKRCAAFSHTKEIKQLQHTLQQRKQQRKEKQQQRIAKIMEIIKKKSLQKERDWYIAQILQMPGYYTITKLLSFLNSPDKTQRIFAIQTLGKLGNTSIKMEGKDSVEWLLEKLEKLDPGKDFEEAEAIIWALGWLKDARANKIVLKTRLKSKEHSIFWQRTEKAYTLLPVSTENINSVVEFLKRGNMKFDKKDYKGAMADYLAAKKLNPNHFQIYNCLAMALQVSGNLKEAMNNYNKAILLNPSDVMAYNNRGLLKNHLGNIDGAIADFNRVLALNPKVIDTYLNRGNLLKLKGDFRGALRDFNMIIKLNPKEAVAYCNRGNLRHELGDLKGAIKDFNKAIELIPKNPDIIFNRGIVYFSMRNHQRALDDFNQTLRVNPRYTKAYFYLGNIHHARKNYKKALDNFTLALKFNSHYTEAYYRRGNTFYKMGALQKSLQDCSKAIALKPNWAFPYRTRGIVLLGLKKYSSGVADFRRYLRLRPNAPDARTIRMYIKQYG